MAPGFLTHLSGGQAEARSAGSTPGGQVNPSAVAAMAEVGIDISSRTPKVLTTSAVQTSDVVITMGRGDAPRSSQARATSTGTWKTPAGQGVEVVRPIRDEIKARVQALLSEFLPDDFPPRERLPIVPATRGLRKNLGGPSFPMPARSVHRDTGAK